MKTLLLVDTSSYLYRAFHALPDLRTKTDEPTGAIYGVLNMLRRLHKDVPADYSACIFDAKGRTFRDALYPEYKATRKSMPDELGAQVAPLYECIRAMGWPLLEVDGVEADDVIGTLACTATKQDVRTVISSSDKDLTQLVNAHVTMVNTMTNETFDAAGVLNKFGVPPELIIDYLTLIGDSVDNIPGVDKVGPKTACKLLAQYATLDNLIAHAEEVTGTIGENLRKAKDWLPQARRLITVKCDVELAVGMEDLTLQPQDKPALARLYDRFEFKTWRQELGNDFGPAVVAIDRVREYETVLESDQLERWIARIEAAPLTAVETQSTSTDGHVAQLVGLSLAIEPGKAAYIPLAHRYPGVTEQLPFAATLERLRPWLESADHAKISHNAKDDMHVLNNHGIRLAGVRHDPMLQSYVIESHKNHELDNLAQRHLGIQTLPFHEVCGKGVGQICIDQVSVERATEYAAEYADITLQLHEALYPQIEKDEKLKLIYHSIEMPVSEVLWDMERHGVLLNRGLLDIQSGELGGRMVQIEEQAQQLAGQPFNLNSPKQIQEVLFDRLQLPVLKKTPSGQPSTDEEVLQDLAVNYPLPKLILEYRGLSKLKSTYTDKLPRMADAQSGRVHTNYRQAVAITGRLSSNEPNLQNIPIRNAEGRRIREAFIAPDGFRIVSADYSQVELRIMAHLSQDPSLLAAFTSGEDVHRRTASEIFSTDPNDITSEQRRYAKIINFGLIYGMSAFGLASNLGIERSAAQQYMDRYFTRYPGVAQYMQRTRDTAHVAGYVETVFGRRLFLNDINASNSQRRQGAERAAINAPMQGTAADLIKLAMIAVHGWLLDNRLKTRLLMQVHDELVLETPNEELALLQAELPRLMIDVAALDVPLVVDLGVGSNWDEAH